MNDDEFYHADAVREWACWILLFASALWLAIGRLV